jgi:hypothetical protein
MSRLSNHSSMFDEVTDTSKFMSSNEDNDDESQSLSLVNRKNINKQQLKQKQQQQLTSSELKEKLIEIVRNKGILDSVKSQLRKKLVLEIDPNFKTSNANKLTKTQSKSNLALNTLNCLFLNHLRANSYDYTLSVFMPECGISLNEIYSLEDILHILKVSPQSKLYKELVKH